MWQKCFLASEDHFGAVHLRKSPARKSTEGSTCLELPHVWQCKTAGRNPHQERGFGWEQQERQADRRTLVAVLQAALNSCCSESVRDRVAPACASAPTTRVSASCAGPRPAISRCHCPSGHRSAGKVAQHSLTAWHAVPATPPYQHARPSTTAHLQARGEEVAQRQRRAVAQLVQRRQHAVDEHRQRGRLHEHVRRRRVVLAAGRSACIQRLSDRFLWSLLKLLERRPKSEKL